MKYEEIPDLEIRNSIPCVLVRVPPRRGFGAGIGERWDVEEEIVCLPVGYSIGYDNEVYYRGVSIGLEGGEPGNLLYGEHEAWDHAIAMEKHRRGITPERVTVSDEDKARLDQFVANARTLVQMAHDEADAAQESET